jgi:hypothetical protein
MLHLGGEVVGTCDAPLELYAVIGRRTVSYALTTAASAGQPFHLIADPSIPVQPAGSVHIELVHGATVWYAVDVPYKF